MAYFCKVLSKEAKSLLNVYKVDSHQVLQQLHLKFNPIHFRYQTDQCNKVPVQDNQTIEEYTSWYKWYQVNKACVLDEKYDIGSELTQDMFISNMQRYDEVRSIVTLERKSPDQYIADQYKKEISSIQSYRCRMAYNVLPMLMPEVFVVEVNQMYTV